jgi:hypothetical protein
MIGKRWLLLRDLFLSLLDSPSLSVVKRLVRATVKREQVINVGVADGNQLGAVHSVFFERSFEFTVRVLFVVVRKMAKERALRIKCCLRVQAQPAGDAHNEPA